MVLDHLLVVGGFGQSPIRYTLTRAAMPAFMVISGALFRRIRWERWLRYLAAGLLLPVVVVWIDNPNILVLWAFGVVVLDILGVLGRLVPRLRAALPWLVVVAVLTYTGNRFGAALGSSGFEPLSVVALMVIGAQIGRESLSGILSAFAGVPRWVRSIGRHSFGWYVGHLLVLVALQQVGVI
jgi:hypothetical protein